MQFISTFLLKYCFQYYARMSVLSVTYCSQDVLFDVFLLVKRLCETWYISVSCTVFFNIRFEPVLTLVSSCVIIALTWTVLNSLADALVHPYLLYLKVYHYPVFELGFDFFVRIFNTLKRIVRPKIKKYIICSPSFRSKMVWHSFFCGS